MVALHAEANSYVYGFDEIKMQFYAVELNPSTEYSKVCTSHQQ